MSQLIQTVATGLSMGSVYAVIALAIVLIYRSTGVVNFAQGEMAMFSTFIAWSMITFFGTWSLPLNMNYWLPFFLAMLVAAFIGAAVERVILRPVEEAPVINSVIVTLGLFTLFNTVAIWRYGGIAKPFPSPTFFHGSALSVGPIVISRLNIGVFCMSVLIMLILYLFLNYTKLGLAMRAAAENRMACRMVGIPASRMLTLGWALSAAVGAVAGMLVAPIVFLSASMMFATLIFAFAAAVLGGLQSLPGAIVGGLLLGIIQNMAGTYIGSEIDITTAFFVIVLVLLVRPTGLLGRRVLRKV
jgi:branched-chain amino acid transport system permease protein